MSARGLGTAQNGKEAAGWYRKAAEAGYVSAQLNLGALYYAGQGVAKNPGEAAKWLRLAAQQGNGRAQFNLAMLYVQGEGVAQSLPHALVWFSAAAATLTGEESRMANAQAQDVANAMTPAQAAEAKKLAAACKAGNYKSCA